MESYAIISLNVITDGDCSHASDYRVIFHFLKMIANDWSALSSCSEYLTLWSLSNPAGTQYIFCESNDYSLIILSSSISFQIQMLALYVIISNNTSNIIIIKPNVVQHVLGWFTRIPLITVDGWYQNIFL